MGYAVTIFGATGKTGALVLEGALKRGWRVRAATRRPPTGGEWIRFEWDQRERWPEAFRGSDAAYLLTPFKHPGAPETTPELLEAVAGAGVKRIVLLSSLDAEHAESDDPLIAAEAKLRELDVGHAILRPTWFFDNFSVGSFASMTEAGRLRLPAGNGRIPFVDIRDVSAVATAALADDGPEGILPLTGPAAINHHEVADALAVALRRSVRYQSVSDEEFITRMVERGFGYEYSRFLADALRDVAEGRLSIPVYDTVEQICGRPAYDVREFARHFAKSRR